MKSSRYYHILGISHLCANLYSQPKTLPLCLGNENFMVLNPLKNNARKDANVRSSYNYLFEFDRLSLSNQYKLFSLLKDKGILASVVYSGAKSLHFIIKSQYSLPKVVYQFVWHRLNEDLFHQQADTACSHPARLTRNPHAIRLETNKEQKLLYLQNNCLNIDIYLQEWKVHMKYRNKKSLPIPSYPSNHKIDRHQYLIHCAKRKAPHYLDFVLKRLPEGSYPLRIQCIAWIKCLTYPYSTTPLYTKEEIYQDFVHGTSKHQKRLEAFLMQQREKH